MTASLTIPSSVLVQEDIILVEMKQHSSLIMETSTPEPRGTSLCSGKAYNSNLSHKAEIRKKKWFTNSNKVMKQWVQTYRLV